MRVYLPVLLMLLLISGCGNVKDKYQEQANIAGAAGANQAVKANNEDLNRKAKLMEDDLARRQNFFQALQGKYVGDVYDMGIHFRVNLEIASTVPPFDGSRVRAEAEIVNDLTNLFLNAQVAISVISNDSTNGITSGCNFTAIHPDIQNGRFTLQSTDGTNAACPNLFSIFIQPDRATLRNYAGSRLTTHVLARSRTLAAALLDGKTDAIPALHMIWRSTRTSDAPNLILKRDENAL